MFEKFNESGKLAVVRAQNEARQFHHNWIGTEHLLLGVMDVDGNVAQEVLTALGVGLDDVRHDVEAIIGFGREPLAPHIALTPRSKKVLELSVLEARQLNHTFVGAVHLLLGLLREGDGVAGHVLAERGINLDLLRLQVIQLLADHSSDPPPPAN